MPHYRNGRLAQEGDPVIALGYTGQVTVGKLHSIIPGSESCNGSVAEVVPGGVQQLTCQTIGSLYHAEDARLILECMFNSPKPPEAPVCDVVSDPDKSHLPSM